MDDDAIRDRIEELEAEERDLRRDEQDAAEHGRDDKVAEDAERLAAIRGELAQSFDLLRRRQAARDGGQDPNSVSPRSPEEIDADLG